MYSSSNYSSVNLLKTTEPLVFKQVNFIVCDLYLNKAFFKIEQCLIHNKCSKNWAGDDDGLMMMTTTSSTITVITAVVFSSMELMALPVLTCKAYK